MIEGQLIVQEGQESNCWPNMDYAFTGTELVAEDTMNTPGKLIFTFSCIIIKLHKSKILLHKCLLPNIDFGFLAQNQNLLFH